MYISIVIKKSKKQKKNLNIQYPVSVHCSLMEQGIKNCFLQAKLIVVKRINELSTSS